MTHTSKPSRCPERRAREALTRDLCTALAHIAYTHYAACKMVSSHAIAKADRCSTEASYKSHLPLSFKYLEAPGTKFALLARQVIVAWKSERERLLLFSLLAHPSAPPTMVRSMQALHQGLSECRTRSRSKFTSSQHVNLLMLPTHRARHCGLLPSRILTRFATIGVARK